jgi:hypothetical protein
LSDLPAGIGQQLVIMRILLILLSNRLLSLFLFPDRNGVGCTWHRGCFTKQHLSSNGSGMALQNNLMNFLS